MDEVLLGGLAPNHVYLLEGDPGTGKTTLAMQFLLEGCRRGEPGLYVTLSESDAELRDIASSHGWDLQSIDIFELTPVEASLQADNQYTVFHPDEVQLGETTKLILDRVEQSRPARIVLDSLAELRLLATDSRRYRRQLLALKQYFTGRPHTVLFLDDRTSQTEERQLHSVVHGVITLERLPREYGKCRRRLEVSKFRGRDYRDGYHDYAIETGGMKVYPRLSSATRQPRDFAFEPVSSGNAKLDSLLGGGLGAGSGSLFVGPSGSGKTTLAIRHALATLNRGENVSLFTFDEGCASILTRAKGLGMNLAEHVEAGRLRLDQIDPAELSPGEFAHRVKSAVEGSFRAKMVIIDSLNGYLMAMPEEQFLSLQIHELLTYLNHNGVATILVLAQQGILGSMQTAIDVSYLADTIMLLRFFEAAGEVRRAVSIVKKRCGWHEQTIRELRIGGTDGIEVGFPLTAFQGVLEGTPQFSGDASRLLND